MNNLAVVIVSCDRNAWLWSAWYHYFAKNFGFKYPVYLLNETQLINFPDVTQILVDIPEINLWTKRLRESVAQIPEDDLFIMMDDFLIKKRIPFADMYDTFKAVGCDSLRIMPDPDKLCKRVPVDLYGAMYELTEDSDYKISYSPNIWKKSFLLRCIQKDESPWVSEVHGSQRVRGAYLLSTTVTDWYIGAVRRGKLIEEGKQLIEKI